MARWIWIAEGAGAWTIQTSLWSNAWNKNQKYDLGATIPVIHGTDLIVAEKLWKWICCTEFSWCRLFRKRNLFYEPHVVYITLHCLAMFIQWLNLIMVNNRWVHYTWKCNQEWIQLTLYSNRQSRILPDQACKWVLWWTCRFSGISNCT